MVNPTWTFITVTYNSADDLSRHWRGERPPSVEWIVVDNASRDRSVEVAEELDADRVIPLDRNVGFGRANNAGFAHARGDYVAFVNPDVVVDFDTLPELERHLSAHPAIVGPQLVYPDGSPQPSGRGTPSLTNKVLSRLGHSRTKKQYYVFAHDGELRDVTWVIGAAVTGKRETFGALGESGPWDPAFFVYYEDSDLGIRAWQAGYPVRLAGGVHWVHSWARETTGARLRPWVLEMKAMLTFYGRYPRMLVGAGTGPPERLVVAHPTQSSKEAR